MKNIIFFGLSVLSTSLYAASVTVSGISSGGYMAQQFHTAFSSDVSGVGIVAAGPYYCAKGSMIDALNKCMKTPMGMPRIETSLDEAKKVAKMNLIDPLDNIKNSKVFIVSGIHDNTVVQEVAELNVDVYKAWGVKEENLRTDFKIPVGHAFPTDNYGNRCEIESKSPWISNCNRDMAGEILEHLLGNLKMKTEGKNSRLFSFQQLKDHTGKEYDRLSMHTKGYVYIPEGCDSSRRSSCPVHIAFHGCQQTLDDIGEIFVKNTGYNDWAESNKIIVLYPQARRTQMMSNPNGCWDWWGYSGENYHTKKGLQMKVVYSLLKAVQSGRLVLDKEL